MVEEESEFPLRHPEIRELFRNLLSTLVAESDRGAVLVGAAHVEMHLGKLFENVAPKELSKDKRKSLLKYPGPLSTFSGRTEVAYATRLIGRSLYDALHALRKIRNEVAHNSESFSLRAQSERVRQMYDLGPGVPVGINRMALEVMTHLKIGHALETVKHPDEDRPYFKTPHEVIEFILDSPEIMEIFDEQLPRYELAVGIALVCSLLVVHREAASRLVGEDETLAAIEKKMWRSDQAGTEMDNDSSTD